MSVRRSNQPKKPPLFPQQQARVETARPPQPQYDTKSGYPKAAPLPDSRKAMPPPPRRPQGGGDPSLPPPRVRQVAPNNGRAVDSLSERDVEQANIKFTPRPRDAGYVANNKVNPTSNKLKRPPPVTVEDEDEGMELHPRPQTQQAPIEVEENDNESVDTDSEDGSPLPEDREEETPPQYGEVTQDQHMQPPLEEKPRNTRQAPVYATQQAQPRSSTMAAAPLKSQTSTGQASAGPAPRAPHQRPHPVQGHNTRQGEEYYSKSRRSASNSTGVHHETATHMPDPRMQHRSHPYAHERPHQEPRYREGPVHRPTVPGQRARPEQIMRQPGLAQQDQRHAHMSAPPPRRQQPRAPPPDGYAAPSHHDAYDHQYSQMPPANENALALVPTRVQSSSYSQHVMTLVQELDHEQKSLAREAEQLQSRLEAMVTERDSLKAQSRALEASLTSEKDENSRLKGHLAQLKSDHLVEKANSKRKTSEYMLKADGIIGISEERISRLEAVNADYVEQMATMKSLVSAYQNAGAERIDESLAKARKAIDESKQISQAFGQTEKELSEVKGQLEDASKQLQEVQKSLDECSSRLDVSTKANAGKDATALKALYGVTKGASGAGPKGGGGSDPVTLLAQQAKEQSTRLSELETSSAVLQENVRKLERQNKALSKAYEVVLNFFDVSIIGMDGDALQATHEALERALDNWNKTKAGYKLQLDKLKTERDETWQKLYKLQASSNLTEAEKEVHHDEVSKLQKELEAERTNTRNMGSLQKEVDKLQEQLRAKEQELVTVKDKEKHANTQAIAYKNAYTENEKKLKLHEANAQQQIRELNAKHDKAVADAQANDEQCKSLQAKLADATVKGKAGGIGVSAAANVEAEKQKWQKIVQTQQDELSQLKDKDASTVKRWHSDENTAGEKLLIEAVYNEARLSLEQDVEQATAEKYSDQIKELQNKNLKAEQSANKWKQLYNNLQEHQADIVNVDDEDENMAQATAKGNHKTAARKAQTSKAATQSSGFTKASDLFSQTGKKRLHETVGTQGGKTPKKARFDSMNVSSDMPIPEYEDEDESSPLSQPPDIDAPTASQMERDTLQGLFADDLDDVNVDDEDEHEAIVPATQPKSSQRPPAASQKKTAPAKSRASNKRTKTNAA